ncbi:MAG: aldehyde dehydrogenase family protein [Brevinematales bacterium]|nr:aldehyde dehydrogenase family protein [Brevinematales bacterium]
MQNIFEEIFSEVNGIKNYKILINGCWTCFGSEKTFNVYNPATNEVFAKVPDCSIDDAKAAIEAAKNFSEMKKIPPIHRLEIMEKASELVLANKDYLAEIITKESGKPISVSLGEVKATYERLRLTMEEVRVLYGEYLPGEWVEDTKGKFAIVLRKPIGVVLAISPFNYPLYIAAAKIIPAILAGNTVIAKPASDTPLSLIHFVRILEVAGVPTGAIQVITGRGRDIGDVLITSDDIDAISFTGSTKVGEYIASKAGIKKLHLELGGKASAIVLEDANIELAAKQICRGTFRNSGQRCDAVSRVLINKKIKEKFIEKILEEVKNYKIGDPMDKNTVMGTVINEGARDRIHSLVEDALSKGAKLLSGGKYNGLFYEATILDNVNLSMRVATEEIFGPIMPIIEVSSTEEAIKISNSSEYGLDSCIFTENIHLALKIAKELEDGSVTINSAPAHGVGHFPFGGNKKSGLGREGIKYSIDELTKLHTIIINEE